MQHQETGVTADTSNTQVMPHVATIVAAFVGNNRMTAEELPALINTVANTLTGLNGTSSASTAEISTEKRQPAVSIKKSVTPDYIISLEDGQKFKSLKRHLRTKYNMTPDQYRAKWGLAPDYPMVAPNYAEARSRMAKALGLGQNGRGGTARKSRAPSRKATPAAAA